MKTKEIDAIIRPFTSDEAMKHIGSYIMRRPGVFADDDGSVFRILGVQPDGFIFWEKDYYWKSYKFDNIIYDYLFENGSFIGVYK